MPGLDDIVKVTITAQTRTPTRQGFGTPLLATYHDHWRDRVREYAEPDEMLTDGFTAGEAGYRMAVALASQNPRPRRFKVGRRSAPHTQSVRFTPSAATEGLRYSMRFVLPDARTVEAFYVVRSGDTLASISAGLTTSVTAVAATHVTATDGTGRLTVTARTPGKLFEVETSKELALEDVTPDPGLTTDLSAFVDADDDWYALLLDSNSAPQITTAANWIETHRKILLATVCDAPIFDRTITTDIATSLRNGERYRTALLWSDGLTPAPAAAWLGRMLPTDPGASTWAFKSLSGIQPTKLTTTQLSALEAKNVNLYQRVAGANMTWEGKVAAGEYIDTVRFIDWLTARTKERFFGLKLNREKLPFTDETGDLYRAELLAQLDDGIAAGGLARKPEPTVDVPLVADIPEDDRRRRRFTGIRFRARLAGAVHATEINGDLTV